MRRIQFEPPVVWLGDTLRIDVELDRRLLGQQEHPAIELIDGAGDLVTRARLEPISNTGPIVLLRAHVLTDRKGRMRHRLVAVGPQRSRVLVSGDPKASAPTVLERTLFLEVDGPRTLNLTPGADDVLVTLNARARGGDENLTVRWRRDEGAWSSGRQIQTRLGVGTHAFQVRVADTSGRGQERSVPVVVRPAPSTGEMGVEIDLELPKCAPRRDQRCTAHLTARPTGAVSPPVHFAWNPDVRRPDSTWRDGAQLIHEYGLGHPVARVRMTDGRGQTVTRDVPITLRGIRVAISPLVAAGFGADFIADLEARRARAILDGNEQLSVLEGDALRVHERTMTHPTAAICEARRSSLQRALKVGFDGSVPWDGVLCTRLTKREDGKVEVWVHLLGEAGEPDRGTDPDTGTELVCEAADAECLDRIEGVVRQFARLAERWAVLIAPPDPTVRPTAALSLTSDAPATHIWINGADVGRAPYRLRLTAGVPFIIEMQSPHCPRRVRHEVTLSAGEQRMINGVLCRPGALLSVRSDPPGATVLVDGWSVSAAGELVQLAQPGESRVTPIESIPLSIGRHEVTVMHAGHVTAHREVVVPPDGHLVVDVTLRRLENTLRIRNRGTSRFLYLDGQAYGIIGPGHERTFTDLTLGSHRVCIHHRRTVDERAARCRTIDLPSGLDITFDEEGPPLEPADLIAAREKLVVQEAKSPLRFGLALDAGYTLSVADARHWLAETEALGGSLLLEGIPTPLWPLSLGLDYRYAEGDTTRAVVEADAPSTIEHHGLGLAARLTLPLPDVSLAVGARVQGSFFRETINPGQPYAEREDRWGIALGPVARLRVLGEPNGSIHVLGEYQYLLVLAPVDGSGRRGQVHHLGAVVAAFF